MNAALAIVITMTSGSLEIPIDHLEAAEFAAPRVDRIEVCAELDAQGWSPGLERLREIVGAVSDHPVQVVSLIRPRCCPDFIVSSDALNQARIQILESAAAGAHGVVIGFIDHSNHLDRDSTHELSDLARSLGLTVSLHRAFDFDVDPDSAIRIATECGVERVLTSGAPGWQGATHPLESRLTGISKSVRLSERHAAALDRPPVRIVACGGVRGSNASYFLKVTPDLHASCRRGARFHHDDLEDLVLTMSG